MTQTVLAPRMLVRALSVAAAIAMTAIVAAAQPVSVTGATPPTGEQDTVGLVVRVTGRNFAPGARADFFKSKTSDPAGVTVRETRFVSATELDAVIDIALTAELSYFDVRVTNLAGRSGKGSDLFQVVQKAGAAAACNLGTNPANFVLISTLNPGIAGGTYSTELGLGMKAASVTVGNSSAVMVAVGRTGGLEVFFLDPTKVPPVGSTPAAGFVDAVNPHATINLAGATWIRELALGDVDDDGTPDILASDRTKVWLLKGSRSGNHIVFAVGAAHAIAVPSTVPVSNFFGWGVALGDLDGGPGDEIVISQAPIQSGKKSHHGKVHLFGWNGSVVAFRHTVVPAVSPTLAQADGYGRSVTVGDFTGATLKDVVAGAPGRGAGGMLWIFPDPWNATVVASVATVVPVAVPATSDGYPVGWRVQAADANGDGALDLATVSAWGGSSDTGTQVRGDVFAGGTVPAGAEFRFQPIPGLHTGWGSTGIEIGNLFGGAEPEVVVGAPNATTSSSCANVGRLFVFPGRATPTAPWQPYELRPPTLDEDYGAYGWSAAFVDGLNLLLVAEKGRTVNGVANAGQIYVYRVD